MLKVQVDEVNFVDGERNPNFDDDESLGDDGSCNSKANDASSSARTSVTKYDLEEARDEVKEILKMSRTETQLINTWRVILLLLLVITAAAVSSITYVLLKQEEEAAFKVSFEKNGLILGEAIVSHSKAIKMSLRGLADAVTAYSESVNATWPFFYMPFFASYAQNALVQSGGETVFLFTRVPHHLREDYAEWQNTVHYGRVKEANEIVYGDLSRMPDNSSYIPDITWKIEEGFVPDMEREYYFATSEVVPPPMSFGLWNLNINSIQHYEDLYQSQLKLRNECVWTNVREYTTAGVVFTQEQHEKMHSNSVGSQADQPHSFIWTTVFQSLQNRTSEPVASLNFAVAWDVPLRNALPEGAQGINVILRNNCNQSFTYLLNGPDVFYIGEQDQHDRAYDDLRVSFDLWESDHPDYETVGNHCLFSVDIYPTSVFKESRESSTPLIYAAVIAGTFLLMILAFIIYDLIVKRRNNKLVSNAAHSNAIITSLFPNTIRDRIVNQDSHQGEGGKAITKDTLKGAPIADLHLESTIMFADIVGFTAWSSVREPTQVFKLLEALYTAFDKLAEVRGVFKVETVGDCYVAATGIPVYREDHVSAMVRFASDIMNKMDKLVKHLEIILGPDTGDLSLRIGIHSGPVTAGVLRGQRSRFQLFGDTVNTTARIESAGRSGKIHLSSDSANILIKQGKGHWIEKRKDLITAKGKGNLQTYWLKSVNGWYCVSDLNDTHCSDEETTAVDSDELFDSSLPQMDGNHHRINRLINWSSEMLLGLLKQIVARRSTTHSRSGSRMETRLSSMEKSQGSIPLEEVQEIICLPDYNAYAVENQAKDADTIDLGEDVVAQVHEYVKCIASLYRSNAFHNFEHATHVAMSVTKLLSRIVAPKHIVGNNRNELHDHTYGITSDPLTQFACAFSALIHDVDHLGVPNAQLVKEKHPITSFYNNRSVAEQFSLTLSWDLLMEDRFKDFRRCLYTNEAELMRFRHLVVNSVMATDIADKDLKNLRNARWAKAFDESNKVTTDSLQAQTKADIDRKATIVIEHLIQASDVAHTMQHWHIYRKWNERLFMEMYQAYLDGRAEKDPSEFWYSGEIGFFDFYIIPLAKKLKECGVFGISSDEYLNYALRNREEWERRGQEVIAEMVNATANFAASPSGQAEYVKLRAN